MRRWVYTKEGQPLSEPYEVTGEWSDAPRLTNDGLKFELENVKGMNGERFGTAGQFERYLSKNDLALHSDTASHVAKIQAKRESDTKANSGGDKEGVMRATVDAWHQLKARGGKR